jgi:MFS family permease
MCLTALGIAAVSFAAPAITVVDLKSIAADLDGERSVPALAYSLAWLGASVGGIAIGQAAERFGVRATMIFGSLMVATGLLLAQTGNALSLLVGYGVFIGLLGNAAMNAPLYTYVSRWFDRCGTALAPARQRLLRVGGDLGADLRGSGGANRLAQHVERVAQWSPSRDLVHPNGGGATTRFDGAG